MPTICSSSSINWLCVSFRRTNDLNWALNSVERRIRFLRTSSRDSPDDTARARLHFLNIAEASLAEVCVLRPRGAQSSDTSRKRPSWSSNREIKGGDCCPGLDLTSRATKRLPAVASGLMRMLLPGWVGSTLRDDRQPHSPDLPHPALPALLPHCAQNSSSTPTDGIRGTMRSYSPVASERSPVDRRQRIAHVPSRPAR